MTVPSRLVPRCGVAVSTLCAVLALAAAPAGAADGAYVVQLTDAPVASYKGGKAGLPATSPASTGRALRPRSVASQAYKAYLARRQR
ncbi:MAG TPA: hypothetical protein VN213_09000, partial [Solirubrobacteraceae bacterium]|nr:hypothetical protein [Solirubrobacteraceae bacterium]